jgi:hypothetical protein
MSGSVYTGTPNGIPQARAGVAYATVDGDAIDVVSELEYDATYIKREGLIGQSGIQGFSEMPKQGMMKFKARDAGNLTVSLFMNKRFASLVFRLANGKIVTGDNMYCEEVSPVATQEATFDLTFKNNPTGAVTEIPR